MTFCSIACFSHFIKEEQVSLMYLVLPLKANGLSITQTLALSVNIEEHNQLSQKKTCKKKDVFYEHGIIRGLRQKTWTAICFSGELPWCNVFWTIYIMAYVDFILILVVNKVSFVVPYIAILSVFSSPLNYIANIFWLMAMNMYNCVGLICEILLPAYCYTPPAPCELWSKSCEPNIWISGTLDLAIWLLFLLMSWCDHIPIYCKLYNRLIL